MGVNVSKQKSSVILDRVFNSKLYAQCPVSNIKQVQVVGPIVVDKDCTSDVVIKQEAYYDSDCAIDTITKSLSDFYIDNKQDVSKGFIPNLVNIDTTQSDTEIRDAINREVRAMCGGSSVDQNQVIGSVICRGGRRKLEVVQKFVGSASCVVEELFNRADKWDAEVDQEVDRSLGLSGIIGKFFTFEAFLIALFVGLVITFLFWLSKGGGAETVTKVAPIALAAL